MSAPSRLRRAPLLVALALLLPLGACTPSNDGARENASPPPAPVERDSLPSDPLQALDILINQSWAELFGEPANRQPNARLVNDLLNRLIETSEQGTPYVAVQLAAVTLQVNPGPNTWASVQSLWRNLRREIPREQ